MTAWVGRCPAPRSLASSCKEITMGKIATKKATRHLAHHQPAGPADAPTKSHECVVKDVILRTKPEDSRAISDQS